MTLAFTPLSTDSIKEYHELFSKCREKASDYTFINLWGWSEERRYIWAFRDGLCWLRATAGASPAWWAPVGDWRRPDWAQIMEDNVPPETAFERVPQELAEIWSEQLQGRCRMEEQRNEWEYLYDFDKMVSLSGNKLHRKKNLLTQFKKKYDYTYSPVSCQNIGAIREMQAEWRRWRGCRESPGLEAENIAITRVLDEWERLPGILGGEISVNDRIAAYTVAEDLGNGTVVIHFEKGLEFYKGVYQAINQMFLSSLTSPAGSAGFHTVNREQDMGVQGIRQAKESYSPTGFLKKYRVTWTG
ncbi:MAG: phosphatidylglycerol lysyltransferase domain-containing protein [Synergistaceae bacterium]|nr:phosphatidylglycerol lysyltransferase domain-containing protein [Synergistaceae bacterium]